MYVYIYACVCVILGTTPSLGITPSLSRIQQIFKMNAPVCRPALVPLLPQFTRVLH